MYIYLFYILIQYDMIINKCPNKFFLHKVNEIFLLEIIFS